MFWLVPKSAIWEVLLYFMMWFVVWMLDFWLLCDKKKRIGVKSSTKCVISTFGLMSCNVEFWIVVTLNIFLRSVLQLVHWVRLWNAWTLLHQITKQFEQCNRSVLVSALAFRGSSLVRVWVQATNRGESCASYNLSFDRFERSDCWVPCADGIKVQSFRSVRFLTSIV